MSMLSYWNSNVSPPENSSCIIFITYSKYSNGEWWRSRVNSLGIKLLQFIKPVWAGCFWHFSSFGSSPLPGLRWHYFMNNKTAESTWIMMNVPCSCYEAFFRCYECVLLTWFAEAVPETAEWSMCSVGSRCIFKGGVLVCLGQKCTVMRIYLKHKWLIMWCSAIVQFTPVHTYE